MLTPPQLIVLAGPNGAGKSTLAPHLLRDTLGINEFVNADKIAEGLSGYSPEGVAVEAGKIMLQRLYELMERGRSFAIETTLSGRSWLKLFRKSQEEYGYQVNINFIWVRNVQICVDRVNQRQKHGAHDIPEKTILRRYNRCLNIFVNEYSHLADQWRFLDNTQPSSVELIAEKVAYQEAKVHVPEVWNTLTQGIEYD